jgi:hypothetical protein
MAEEEKAVDRVGHPKHPEAYWLPEIVHVHLTALETGWLTAVLLYGKVNDVPVNVRDEQGNPQASTMAQAIFRKLCKAWENHDGE